MRILTLLACVLHFTAVFATSGVGLCVGNDGHASYEWEGDDCCGDLAPAVAPAPPCCEDCEKPADAVLSAAPECGGCIDALAPLLSGLHAAVAPALPPPAPVLHARATREVPAEAAVRLEECGFPPAAPLPLRC